MILVHLSVNEKAAIINPEMIMFAEECEGVDNGKAITFTRVYLKQPLQSENGTNIIDVRERVQRIANERKRRRFFSYKV